MKKEDLTPLSVGLKKLETLPKDFLWWENNIEKSMDKFVNERYKK